MALVGLIFMLYYCILSRFDATTAMKIVITLKKWIILLIFLIDMCYGFFGFFSSKDKEKELKLEKSHFSGCLHMDLLDCSTSNSPPTGSKAYCNKRVHGGICSCVWGEKISLGCQDQADSCGHMCLKQFRSLAQTSTESIFENTVWLWNRWREVKFEAGGIFDAPTDECNAGECFWFSKGNFVFILWGDAGLHSAEIVNGNKLVGFRADGDPCEASLVRNETSVDDENDLYDILELGPEASASEIKKAFRTLSRDLHPDKLIGKSQTEIKSAEEKFNGVRDAYEILGDERLRMIYDFGGLEAVEKNRQQESRRGHQHGGFDSFFGHGGTNQGMPSLPDTRYAVAVELSDLFLGADLTISIKRRLICRGCRKITPKNKERCAPCGQCPREIKMVEREMAPGFVVMQETEVPSKERCKDESTSVNIAIERGMVHGDIITLQYMGSQQPGMLPGHVILSVEQASHPTFTRKGNDLYTTLSISLKEALTGLTRDIAFFDGSMIIIQTDPANNADDIIHVQTTKKIVGKGMPLRDTPSLTGDLYVSFEIEFPKVLDSDKRLQLGSIL